MSESGSIESYCRRHAPEEVEPASYQIVEPEQCIMCAVLRLLQK